jgi:hypothetical protein
MRRPALLAILNLFLPSAILLLAPHASNAQVIETVAGGGPLVVTKEELPIHYGMLNELAVDATDRLLLTNMGRLYAIDTAGQVSVVAGSGSSANNRLNTGGLTTPVSIALAPMGAVVTPGPPGILYVAENGISAGIGRFTTGPMGTAVRIAGFPTRLPEFDGVPAISAQIDWVGGMVYLSNGDLIFSSRVRIRRIDAATGLIHNVASGFDGSELVDIDAAAGVQDTFYIATQRRVFRATTNPPAIVPVAGTGQQGNTGDGGPALQATFSAINDLAVDAAGNVYVTDSDGHRVRKFTPGGVITSIAGDGVPGFSGDGGPGTAARVNLPKQIVVDSRGVVSFVDALNGRVRQIDSLGIIRTFIGNGRSTTIGRSGRESYVAPGPMVTTGAGEVLFFDEGLHRALRRWDPARDIVDTVATERYDSSRAQYEPALLPGLRCDFLAVDPAGQPYCAGTEHTNRTFRVFRLDLPNRRYEALGIDMPAGFNGPFTVDAAGRIHAWVSTPLSGFEFLRRVVRIDGPGAAPITTYQSPSTYGALGALALDPAGVLYIVDSVLQQNREHTQLVAVNLTTGQAAVIVPPVSNQGIQHVAVDANRNLYCNLFAQVLRRTPAGQTSTVVGTGFPNEFTGEVMPAATGGLGRVRGLTVDPQGRPIIGDWISLRIRRVAGPPTAPPGPPTSLAVSATGNMVTFSWTPPEGPVAAERYVIEAGTSSGAADIAAVPLPAAPPAFQATGVPDGTYFVRVRAANSAGTSGPSNEVGFTLGALAPPQDLAFQLSGSALTLTWTPPTTGVPAGGYRIEAGATSGAADIGIVQTSAMSFFVPHIPPGVYFVRVRALSTTGASGPASGEVSFTVSPIEVPGAPSAPSSTVTGRTVTLSWGTPSSGGAPAGYLVEVLQMSGGPVVAQLAVGPVTTISVTSVPPGGYVVRVRAQNSSGTGPPSPEHVIVVG